MTHTLIMARLHPFHLCLTSGSRGEKVLTPSGKCLLTTFNKWKQKHGLPSRWCGMYHVPTSQSQHQGSVRRKQARYSMKTPKVSQSTCICAGRSKQWKHKTFNLQTHLQTEGWWCVFTNTLHSQSPGVGEAQGEVGGLSSDVCLPVLHPPLPKPKHYR